MMVSWKPKHVAKYCLKLQTYFINRCVVTDFNTEFYQIILLSVEYVTFLLTDYCDNRHVKWQDIYLKDDCLMEFDVVYFAR
jgi:hypothetical protein